MKAWTVKEFLVGTVVTGMALCLCVNLSGCQTQCMSASKGVVYETAAVPEVANRSSELAVDVEGRGWAEGVVYYENGGLGHQSLYLVDPYERKGSNDGVFATWGKDDAAAAAAGPALFLVNVLLCLRQRASGPALRDRGCLR